MPLRSKDLVATQASGTFTNFYLWDLSMPLLSSLFALPTRKLRAVKEHSGTVCPPSGLLISRLAQDTKMKDQGPKSGANYYSPFLNLLT